VLIALPRLVTVNSTHARSRGQSSETQTTSTSTSLNAGISAGQNATLNAASQQQLSTERLFTETEADRFYRLLRRLREGVPGAPLRDLDAPDGNASRWRALEEQLRATHEGDFVRIRHAQLFLPPYAAPYAQLRYAGYYSVSPLRERAELPRPGLYAPASTREHKLVERYVSAIGYNPRLPFEIGDPSLPPQLAQSMHQRRVTFLVPARFRGLGTEPSLLAGTTTVVGKLVYKSTDVQYDDRTTFDTFTRALLGASPTVLTDLGIGHPVLGSCARHHVVCNRRLLADVLASLHYAPPVAVIIPIAIYQ
jgi:hypothetical protein